MIPHSKDTYFLIPACVTVQNQWLKVTLLKSGFLLVKLKSSFRTFHDLVDRYGISVSQITTDMFHLS